MDMLLSPPDTLPSVSDGITPVSCADFVISDGFIKIVTLHSLVCCVGASTDVTYRLISYSKAIRYTLRLEFYES